MKAYHFLKDNMEAGSGIEKAWKIGEEREYGGDIAMCSRGYHSSPSWYEALGYAPGSMACIVEIPSVKRGTIKGDDKSVSPKRKLVDCRNTEKVLGAWACDCVERALKKAGVTDKRSWNAIKVVRLFSRGEATSKELAAAGAAAGAAARAAAWDAAGAAAGDAAWDAEIKWQKRRLNWYMKKLFQEG